MTASQTGVEGAVERRGGLEGAMLRVRQDIVDDRFTEQQTIDLGTIFLALCGRLADHAALTARIAALEGALEPFAMLADKFTGPMVEVCNPHPNNPSRNIQPFASIHLERAFQVLAARQSREETGDRT